MRIRRAVPADATTLGAVMVESWLSAHRGQVSDIAWQRRVDEWTPEVSAAGWRRTLDEQAAAPTRQDVLLLAEDDLGEALGLAYGVQLGDEQAAGTAEIAALYVATDRRRTGVGLALLAAAASELADLGATVLRVAVLTANVPARRFYEATGAVEVGSRMVDEDGDLLPCTVYEWPSVSITTAS